MTKKHPVFDYKNCASCSICMQACPLSCLSMTRMGKQGKYKNVFPELTNASCTGCGLCAKSCPMDVIQMEEVQQTPEGRG